MSRIDPDCFPSIGFSDRLVCDQCFGDTDLIYKIRGYQAKGWCTYCKHSSVWVAPFDDIAEFIKNRMMSFYGLAVDQLPYCSAEGGFIGSHWDTEDLLFEEIGLEISSGGERQLHCDLVSEIGDETWCEFDWLSLEIDQSLMSSWEEFCQITMSERRFFFHRLGGSEYRHPDERQIGVFLHEMAELIEALGLIKTFGVGTAYYRARAFTDMPFTTARELGPPPAAICLQSNRMNPPGITMFYGAETPRLAVAESRGSKLSVGRFETTRAIRILDLARLRKVPGFFSEASRGELQGLAFFHQLSYAMAKPVERSDRVHVDYIPTQIVTEFLRDFAFDGSPIDGIQYTSALEYGGANVVLFATEDNVIDADAYPEPKRWLKLVQVNTQEADDPQDADQGDMADIDSEA